MRLFALLALLLLFALPAPVYAHHSMVGGAECGTVRFDGVADMTKGRTGGMVGSADHSVGCMRYVYRNLVGTGIGESYGYSGQRENCIADTQRDVANVYRYYFDAEIDPASVKVTCSPYSGPD